MASFNDRLHALVRFTERYTKTDTAYLFRTAWWSNLGIGFAALFGLGIHIVYANFLSPEEYGLYQYLLALSVIIGGFTLTGMNSAVTQATARGFDGVLKQSVRIQLLWGILPFLIAAAGAVYYWFAGNTILALGLLILGIFTPLTSALNTYSAYLTGKQDFKRGFLYNFGANIPYYAAMALAAVFFKAAIPILIANCLVNTLALYGAYRVTLKQFRPSEETDPKAVSYGKHLSIMNLPGVLLGQVENVLVFHFLGAPMLAVFGLASAFPENIGRLLKFLPMAALPRFSMREGQDLRNSIGLKIVLAIIVSLALAGVYVLLAPFFFELLFPRYEMAIPYSQLYALTMLGTVTSLVTTAMVAQKQLQNLYFFTTLVPLIQAILQIGGIIYFGLLGLIATKIVVVIGALVAALFLFYSHRPSLQQ